MIKQTSRKLMVFIMTLAMIVSFMPILTITAAAYSGGSGTPADPYIISSAVDLNNVRNNLGASYKLSCNLNLSGTSWTPIGDNTGPFTGTFDGNGYIISNYTATAVNVHIVNTSTYDAPGSGLFGQIGAGGIVKKLGVDGNPSAGRFVGGVAACNWGTISQCFNKYNLTSTYESGMVGGIAGYNFGRIENCYNTGNISVPAATPGNWPTAGGIASMDDGFEPAVITKCYNTGNISGGVDLYAAGINGYAFHTTSYCFSTGEITGTGGSDFRYAGIACGGTITGCDFLARGSLTIDGMPGTYTGKADPNYFTAGSGGAYTNFYAAAGWDFTNTWSYVSGGYPILKAFEPAVEISAAPALTENNLDTGSITVTLARTTFSDASLSPSNFMLNNSPAGLGIESIIYTDATHCTVNLAFNGTDFDMDITNLSLTISAAELTTGANLRSNLITVTAAVENPPTNISLSNSSVGENSVGGTTVGTLSSTDADSTAFTYTLVGGEGSTDNASFSIDGNTLRTAFVPNYESKNSYSIRVRSTDDGGLWYEKAFTISITNVNENPADIVLSNSSVTEHSAVGTAVGNFSTTDPDTGDTFSYTLVAGSGSDDNGCFTIVGSTLKLAVSPDYETKSSYSIRVRTADAGGLSYEKSFIITVTDGGDPPSDIVLSDNTAEERMAPGTAVGTFWAVDLNGGTFTYTLASGDGSTDNASFSIDGGALCIGILPDYEMKNSYSIRVRATDDTALYYEESFIISITNINENPSDIILSNSSVSENAAGGTTIGVLSATDVDSGDTFTYALVSGAGDGDNAAFFISGDELKLGAVLDYETKTSYSIRVRTTDAGGLSYDEVFTISVLDGNDQPTNINLSSSSVPENTAAGTAVATLSTTDPNGGAFTYTLVSGAGDSDNAGFSISGTALQLAVTPNYEIKTSYSIRIRTTDGGGLWYEKAFTISVTDVNEMPTNIVLSNNSIAENTPGGSAVGTFSTTDVDAGNTFTYTLAAGAGDTDNASFTISGNELQLAVMPNYEAKPSYSIRVRTTDNGTLWYEKILTVLISDVNEAPGITSGAAASFAENGTGTVYTAAGNDPDASDVITWSIGGTDEARFSINSSTGVLTFKSAPNYESPTGSGGNNIYDLTVTATDGGGLTDTKAITVTVTNVNEAPGITSGAAANFAENGTGTVYTCTATDQDGDSITWSIDGTDAALFSINSSTGVVTFNSVPNYESPADNGGNNVYDLTVTATDEGAGSLTGNKAITVTVTNVNEAPGITSGAAASFAENGTGTVYTAAGSDPDASDVITWSIGGTDAALFSISGSTGVLTFKSAPNYESPTDSGGNNIYDLTVTATDSDGLTDTKAITVTVTNVNEAPGITSGAATSFAENGTGTVYTCTATDEDGDSITWSIGGTDAARFSINSSTGVLTFKSIPNYESPADNGGNNVYDLTVTATDDGAGSLTGNKAITVTVTNVNEAPGITSGAAASFAENGTGTVYTAAGNDPDASDVITWSISGTDAALFSINGSTGVLTFKSAPNYESSTDSGGNNIYDLTVTATDGGGLTDTKTITVTVTNVNEAPGITSGAAVSFAENNAGTVYTCTATDQDGDSITWSIGGADAALFNINSSTGVLTFNSVPDYESPADSGGNNAYDLTVTATDGGGLTDTKTITVTVTNLSEAPGITSGAAVSFAENGTGTVYTAAGSDPDASDVITWSISGTDAARFSISGSTGVLTFKSVPNYESPTDSGGNNIYDLTVTATDSDGLTDTKTITVTVTNVNEAPGITSGAATSFAENGTGTVYTCTATDEDGDSITWSIGGTDAALFSINSSTGVLTFKSIPDYEAPADSGGNNIYDLTVTATDNGAGTLTGSKAITVTVTNVNEAPGITSGAAVSFAENSTGMVYTAVGSDPDASDVITWSIGGTDAARFSINSSTGVLTFKSAPNYESPADNGGDNVYDLTVTATDGGELADTKTITVTVTNVNEAPGITSGVSASFAENGTGTAYTATGSDPDASDIITWRIGGTDAALFSINSSTGVLTFKSAPDYESPADNGGNNIYDLTVTATDNGAGTLTGSKAITITVTNVNEAPGITSGVAASFAENSTGTVYVALGSDPDASDVITWSISGTDAALFNIIGSTGVLTFKSTPNYESPADSGRSNVYDLTVTAADGGGLTDTKTITVMVTNVNEAPNITSGVSASVTEGSTGTVYTATAADEDGDNITWSIGGMDAAQFNINSSTGVLTFKSITDYEAPADSDGNNIYKLNIIASDGVLNDILSISVTVAPNVLPLPSSGNNVLPLSPSGNNDADTDADIEVNGESFSAGESEGSTNEQGKKVTTITVDTDKLESILESQGEKAVVTISVETGSDVAVGVLSGQMVDTMEENGATLVIQTETASYTLPAEEINIRAIAAQLGENVSLSDITVTVCISEPSDELVTVVEDAANDGGYKLVVPAVEFTVSCFYGGRTVEVSAFNAYVERTITIPDGVDPSKITTAIIVEPDGSTHSVPTKIIEESGHYYAVINSLSNSVYAVIYNPVGFDDVTNHWAKDAINDMGSRMIISGVGNDNFQPERDITRAEFAAIIVRALGLKQGIGDVAFKDVTSGDWYYGYIKTAVFFGLITGYEDGTFRPHDKITREQAMTIIARAMTMTGLKSGISDAEVSKLLASFVDSADASDYAEHSIATCLKTGIISGRTADGIAPKATITRAEVAVIIQRLLQKSKLI